MPRFYIPPDAWNPGALVLGPEESHHCAHVMRLGTGDSLTAFNGRGVEATCRIAEVTKRAVRLEPQEITESPPSPCRIALAQAVPKGKNFDLILQKATELGANLIVPVITGRTIVQAAAEAGEQKRAKWRQIVIEAAKQCGQNWLPEVSVPLSFAEALRGADKFDLRLIASLEPDARHLREVLETRSPRPSSVHVFIGPEGDFSPEELASAKGGGHEPITLGKITLRVETAAICALSILNYEFSDRRP